MTKWADGLRGASPEVTAWFLSLTAQKEWLALSAVLDQLPDGRVPWRSMPPHGGRDRKELDSPATQGGALAACGRCAARGLQGLTSIAWTSHLDA